MKLKIHQDILGLTSGTETEVDGTQAEWLVREGYASVADSESDYAQEDKHLVTSADAEHDPTLAANREAPDESEDKVAEAEDEASNDEASKAKAASEAKNVRTGGATQKRDSEHPDAADTERVAYDEVDASTPTAGPAGIPVDDEAPVPAVAPITKDSDTADDSKDSES
jgi:hypothetical protein